ncbi:hypothetical protein MSG28_012150 [Choristoneura fumiferana]|uniref:Uncharacterized protein n=1 Tax=Choristoneura fumiferana TaxID=7141 RepID=A0ACC0KC20_CHOFU|nr:hypothetical protein MSG28_012150 [Choristoneura fumiferana]
MWVVVKTVATRTISSDLSGLRSNNTMSEDMDANSESSRKKEEEEDEEPWGLDLDVWRTDPKGLYGVKPEYLNTLGVTDTLRNWVLVLNFRCGKEDLREVMELAGTVLVCSVHNRRSSDTFNVCKPFRTGRV